MDFQPGDRVAYGSHGVCQICHIEQRKVDRKTVEYYVLRPCASGDATYFVPVHNEVAVSKMRRLLSAQELEAMWNSDCLCQVSWIAEENPRKECYRRLISKGDCAELVGMIRAVQAQKPVLQQAGKKFHTCDENFLKDALRLVRAEVAQILNISLGEAEEYLRTKLE